MGVGKDVRRRIGDLGSGGADGGDERRLGEWPAAEQMTCAGGVKGFSGVGGGGLVGEAQVANDDAVSRVTCRRCAWLWASWVLLRTCSFSGAK